VVRYPPLPKAEEVGRGVGTFGVGPHSDSGYLSLLLQDDVGGLEVHAPLPSMVHLLSQSATHPDEPRELDGAWAIWLSPA
jgi:isopenicillin N synthase-like dioxygenase